MTVPDDHEALVALAITMFGDHRAGCEDYSEATGRTGHPMGAVPCAMHLRFAEPLAPLMKTALAEARAEGLEQGRREQLTQKDRTDLAAVYYGYELGQADTAPTAPHRPNGAPNDLPDQGPALTANLTTQEVADFFRTTPETVRYWRHIGKGPKGYKVGRSVLYAREDVESFIEEARGRGAARPPQGRAGHQEGT